VKTRNARERRGRVLAVSVGIYLLGCGGSGGVPVTADNIGRKYAEIICPLIQGCCEAQGMTFTAGLLEACLIDSSFLPLQRAAGVSSPVFNPDGANECLKAAARYDCTNMSMVQWSCDLVYAGGVALGSPCDGTRHCAQAPNAHAICSESGIGSGGTCVPATLFQAVGAACIRDDLECDLAAGLWCNAGTCAGPLPAGSPCGPGPPWECAKGTYCPMSAPQICTPTTADGAACPDWYSCTPPAECWDGVCVAPPQGACLTF